MGRKCIVSQCEWLIYEKNGTIGVTIFEFYEVWKWRFHFMKINEIDKFSWKVWYVFYISRRLYKTKYILEKNLYFCYFISLSIFMFFIPNWMTFDFLPIPNSKVEYFGVLPYINIEFLDKYWQYCMIVIISFLKL